MAINTNYMSGCGLPGLGLDDPGAKTQNQTLPYTPATCSIGQLYNKDFGRAPDAGGLAFWQNALNSGTSLCDINKSFLNSPEYQQLQATQQANQNAICSQKLMPGNTVAAPATGTNQAQGALAKANTSTGLSTTTLPSWYCAAQQNLVRGAQNVANTAPELNQTVAQGAINTLQDPNNPFSQANKTLGSIASGAANPWIVGACGKVTPNTNTAMGGLFAAQRNQLNEILPTLTAPTQARNVGSGNFGSLRGCTAVDYAKGAALANMTSQQMCAALKNQATGVNAGIGQANVGQEYINNAMNVGKSQMNAPFTALTNAANIINATRPGQAVSTTKTASPLNQLGGLGSLIKCGAIGGASLLKSLGLGGKCCSSFSLANYLKSKCGAQYLRDQNVIPQGCDILCRPPIDSGICCLFKAGGLVGRKK